MYKKYKYLLIAAFSLSFAACEIDDTIEPNLPPEATFPALNTGSADFSNYVALGASFTAGFTDGALFIASQENSFPNIIAGLAGTSMSQPLTNDNIGGLLINGMPNDGALPRLFFDGEGPVRLPATPTTEVLAGTPGPYNNMGVPGAKSFHLLFDGYGNPANLGVSANPYFVRMASSPTATMLGDAMAQSPTFFTLSEIGGNDVLGYATTGGDGTDAITPSDGPPGVGFDQTFGALVTTLTSSGAKGVVTNVPYITDLPHFTTVPYNPLDPTDEESSFGPLVPTLNSVFGVLSLAFVDAGVPERAISFSTSENSPVIINDETLENKAVEIRDALIPSPAFVALLQNFGLPTDDLTKATVATLLGGTYGQARQATIDDLLVLPSSSVIGTVNEDIVAALVGQGLPLAVAGQFAVEGVTLPLADKWVLLPSEQTEIKDATDAYNLTIAAVANSNSNVALVDLNAILTIASTTGIEFDDFRLTTDLVTGGLVSLDGIHLTAKGYALMANKFLEAIDAEFGSNFINSNTTAKAVDYPTNYSPALQ